MEHDSTRHVTVFNELKKFSKENFINNKTKQQHEQQQQSPLKAIERQIFWNKLTGLDQMPDLHHTIDEILPRLYLSGDHVATTKKILDSKRITHIINLASNVENKFEKNIKYKKIVIYDWPTENLAEHFRATFEFIEAALNENGKNAVLVHCNAGVSRSASIIIAYLMQKKLFHYYQDAFKFVKAKRPCICPNEGFVKQLFSLQIKLNS
jgi:predicted protein tyrosine phosphatase